MQSHVLTQQALIQKVSEGPDRKVLTITNARVPREVLRVAALIEKKYKDYDFTFCCAVDDSRIRPAKALVNDLQNHLQSRGIGKVHRFRDGGHELVCEVRQNYSLVRLFDFPKNGPSLKIFEDLAGKMAHIYKAGLSKPELFASSKKCPDFKKLAYLPIRNN